MLAMTEPGWPFGNRPPHQLLWELWKPGYVMSCQINEHPLGWEIRCYLRGNFHYSHVATTRELAEEEAEAQKREVVELGWTNRPVMPD